MKELGGDQDMGMEGTNPIMEEMKVTFMKDLKKANYRTDYMKPLDLKDFMINMVLILALDIEKDKADIETV